MTYSPPADYRPDDYEAEKASNSYLMSLVALMAGMPLPVINLIATAIFTVANRKSSAFVRWHCTQALLSQSFFLCINAPGLYWTGSIVFGDHRFTDLYAGYILAAVVFNIAGFIATMRAAVRTRKGKRVFWWLAGPLADLCVREES